VEKAIMAKKDFAAAQAVELYIGNIGLMLSE
jgi:hypothetical protein